MRWAAEQGMGALAITDHDTVAGLAEAAEAARNSALAFLNGVEITSCLEHLEIHVVGLGIAPESSHLRQLLDAQAQGRIARLHAIAEKLHSLGIALVPEPVTARTVGTVGRMHIAQELRDAGVVRSVQEAFDRYIGRGKPAFVPSSRVPVEEALDAIHAAGGLAFVGHPGLGGVRKQLARLLTFPFDGIEAYHSRHKPGHVEEFIQLAGEKGLLISGGSDCHGRAKGRRPLLGTVRVPGEHYAAIRDALHGQMPCQPDQKC